MNIQSILYIKHVVTKSATQLNTCAGTGRSSSVPATATSMLEVESTPSSMFVGDAPCPLNGDSFRAQQISSNHSDDSDLEPKSDIMMEKLAYRCLDTERMSENERSILRGRLTNDYRRINSEYSTLNRSIRKSLRDHQITPQQLSEVLMELNAFSLRKHDNSKPLLAECLDEIEKAESVDNVFKILRPYGSFFDCYVIKHIVQSQLCTDDDRENLKQYLEKLSDYCKRSIYECPHFATPDQDPKFRMLVMKVDDDISKSFTIKALDAFRDELATTLNLEAHTLHLCSVEEGCLQLTFQVPIFVKDELFPLSHEQKQTLERLHIQKIECDGIQFFALRPFSRIHQTVTSCCLLCMIVKSVSNLSLSCSILKHPQAFHRQWFPLQVLEYQ